MDTLVCDTCGGVGDVLEDASWDTNNPRYENVLCRACGGSGQIPLVRDPILWRKKPKTDSNKAMEAAIEAFEKALKKNPMKSKL